MSAVLNPVTELRGKVFEVEDAMRRELKLLDLPVKHHFAEGLYAREMFIPKGTVVTGHIHKRENMNIMSQGDLSVLTEDGIKRVKAPFTIVSPPGTKRIAYAHEDTIWTTIHPTDERDIEKIEAHFIAKTEQEFLAFCEQEQKMIEEK